MRSLATMSTVEDVLRVVASELCTLLDAGRCSLYLKDAETGVFRGRVGHADTDIDGRVQRLVAGVDADGFTREILDTGQAVLIEDARIDPRPVRSTMRDWHVRSMLGIPLRKDGEVIGLAFVDDEDERHRFTDADRETGQRFAELAADVIGHAMTAAAAHEQLRRAARQNRTLRQAALLDEQLTLLALQGGGFEEILTVVAEHTGKPVALLDTAGRCIASEGLPPDGVASRLENGLPEEGPTVLDPAPELGLSQRLMVEAVAAREQRLGRLVMRELGSAFTALDRHAMRRAAALMALELSAQQRIVAAERDSRAALASDLIRGDRDDLWLVRRGRELGIDLDAPHVLCLVADTDASELEAAFGGHADTASVLVTALAEASACLLPLGEEPQAECTVRATVARVLEAVGGTDARAALSQPFTGAAEAPEAHTQAAQVLRCMQTLSGDGSPRVLGARELGAGRVFLASVDRREADRFALGALGPLLPDGVAPELMATVHAFLTGSRSVRQAAGTLAVHENTIRYRLAKAGELTGLDIAADSDDQVTAHLALRVLQLQGRCPWRVEALSDRPAAKPALVVAG